MLYLTMPTTHIKSASYHCFLLPYNRLPPETYELLAILPPLAHGPATTDLCNFVSTPITEQIEPA